MQCFAVGVHCMCKCIQTHIKGIHSNHNLYPMHPLRYGNSHRKKNSLVCLLRCLCSRCLWFEFISPLEPFAILPFIVAVQFVLNIVIIVLCFIVFSLPYCCTEWIFFHKRFDIGSYTMKKKKQIDICRWDDIETCIELNATQQFFNKKKMLLWKIKIKKQKNFFLSEKKVTFE